MKQVNLILDFFLPRFCIACNSKLSPDIIYICESCFQSIAQPGQQRLKIEYEKKFSADNYITEFASAMIFEKDKPLQHVIHSLKYNENFRVGIYLGKKIGLLLSDRIKEWNADYIVPVPLHRLKKANRGYNQSYYVAKGIRTVHKIQIKSNLIKRARFTQTQTELHIDERKENVKNAFITRKENIIKGKKIILLDDVITTGATISECGRILKEKGASNVYAASVAVAG